MDALENNFVCHIEVTEKQDQPPQELEKEVMKENVAITRTKTIKKKNGVLKKSRKVTICLKVSNRHKPTDLARWFIQFKKLIN